MKCAREDEKNLKFTKVKKTVKVVGIILLILIAVAGVISISSNYFESESKTTKIGFEDIGELDTQVAYTTVIDTITDPRKIFGVTIPFTESKYIYSYDVIVKAGLDFGKINWNESSEKIIVSMPALSITDCYINEDSCKIYHEEQSIFSPITLTEEQEARKKLVERGKEDAIAKGLMTEAKKNAENLVRNFFNSNDKYQNYNIEFKWEK